jgi:hypothetical protein
MFFFKKNGGHFLLFQKTLLIERGIMLHIFEEIIKKTIYYADKTYPSKDSKAFCYMQLDRSVGELAP